eukprot:1452525-Rhodomonas_salina.1
MGNERARDRVGEPAGNSRRVDILQLLHHRRDIQRRVIPVSQLPVHAPAPRVRVPVVGRHCRVR